MQTIMYGIVSLIANYGTQFILLTDGIPPDGKPEMILNKLLLPIAITVDVLAFIGILFAIACLLFNTIFREKT